MNYPKAIVIAAALIAGAIAFSVKAQAGPNPEQVAKYQLVAVGDEVFRLDTTNGRTKVLGVLSGQLTFERDVCNCKGSTAIGGACYAGIGGPAYAGIGGPAYAGIGGPCYKGIGGPKYEGIGGPEYKGIGGPKYDGIGGPAYDGIGGPAYDGIGGPCYAGIGGPCYSGIGGTGETCPAVCK